MLVAIAALAAVLIQTFAYQTFFIPSGSMRDTLEVGDRVVVSKLSYRFGEIERGDIVVFSGVAGGAGFGETLSDVGSALGVTDGDEDFIKRVVALPGETIEIRRNRVLIDGVPLVEGYLREGGRMRNMAAVTIPDDHYFVMGDNRGSSVDSRVNGPIHRDQIVGRATIVIWPPGNWGGL